MKVTYHSSRAVSIVEWNAWIKGVGEAFPV